MIVHIGDFTFAHAELFHDDADKFFGHIHSKLFDGFHQLAVYALGDDFRLAHHEFVTFTAHHFDQDGELKFAATHDHE